ncbi:isochorismatase family protein [Candidatus Dojkabacteria bacterium]|nr:isochorismatase family protein [Candidatus Dojkabacteria bacterium]
MKKALIITDLQSKYDDYSLEYTKLINGLAETARKKGYPVIWTRFVGQEWEVELFGGRAPIPGEEGFEIYEKFDVREDLGDLVIDKSAYNSLSSNELLKILNDGGVETIVLAGRSTGVCILATAYEALNKGFRVEVIREALIDGGQEKDSEGWKLLTSYAGKEINNINETNED